MNNVDFNDLRSPQRRSRYEGVEGGQPLGTVYQCSESAVDIPAPVVPLPGLHDGLGPPVSGSARADSDLEHLVRLLAAQDSSS